MAPKTNKTTNANVNTTTTAAQQTAKSATTPAPAPAPATGLGIKFAKPKAERKKSDRPFCQHVSGSGEKATRCQLRALDGRPFCINHVAAEERLTQDEATEFLKLVSEMTEAQQIRLLARAIGWAKIKGIVKNTAQGQMWLGELVNGDGDEAEAEVGGGQESAA